MKAKVSIVASTQKGARASATRAFTQFYGNQPFQVLTEDARGDYVTVSGKVLTWVCDFTAEAIGRVKDVGAG